jgi:ParB/RepB/Spo0J family partition protein
MATAVQKITLSASRDIPFNKLVLSQSNVRRVKAGVSIEELAEDIARRTLLQSLNVRAVLDAEGKETGMFEIPAGGRRYRALELLVKQKRLAKTAPVPCVVREGGVAEEDSLAENVQRVALHPLDQFRAFHALRDKGLGEEEIAARFFVSPTVVKQRLRLAAVSEKLLEVYAEDGMTLEQLMAFTITRFDAAQIDDHLDAGVTPSVVLMNPPFSALANVDRRMADAALRHISSALSRLTDGGRLVVITGANCTFDNPAWTDAFVRLQERGRVVFSAAIDGAVYAKHGTTIDTRLTVIDKLPADDPTMFPASPGVAPDVATLLGWITQSLTPRLPTSTSVVAPIVAQSIVARASRPVVARRSPVPASTNEPEAVELAYETIDWKPIDGRRITDALYEEYALQSIRIPGAKTHPTKLVQSAAMASIAPPKPSYRPHLPARVISNGLLSDAQLESVIHAGEAHAGQLAGSWNVDETFDIVTAAPDPGSSPGQANAQNAVRFRRGWFLGDGTGAGKGRQVAGVLLDNWLKGRRRAVWVSKSDKLIEDAQRDWSALGQERLLVTPLSRFRQGTPIRLPEGVLFTTYATLRSDARDEKASRVKQIVNWLGRDFDGVIVFDESHAMQNAAGGRGNAAIKRPRSRAAQACAFSTRFPVPASSMFRRRAPPRFTISPTPSGSACGEEKTFPSPAAPSSWRRSRRAASRRWKCWRAI